MFFLVSKVLGFLIAPSNLLAASGVVGAFLWLAGAENFGGAVMALSVLGIAVCGLSPLANILLIPLEERFPRAPEGVAPAGIVVLGGSFDTLVAGARRDMSMTSAAERLTEIAGLARRWPEARIAFTGGSNQMVLDGATEADLAARLFESFGIAPERLVLEGKARNTVENARFVRDLVSPRPGERWLLVTSAYHMPRSVGCFRAADFAVEAWPVDYRTRGPQDAGRVFAAVSGGLGRLDVAVREWVGLVSYRLLGYVDALLPSP
ncbi:MAG: YdcF family protein [Hansschlegelia sp.]